MIHHRSRRRDAGFTLTEMAIVLGVVGVLVAGLWNLISGANQQARDEAAASQQGQLITAVKGFLSSGDGQTYMTTNLSCGSCGPNATFPLPLPASYAACLADPGLAAVMNQATQIKTWCNMLPPGFAQGTINSYGQNFSIRVMRDATNATLPPNSYSFMIATTGGTQISDTSGSRVAALIGGDGGFIYRANVCGAGLIACGSYGGWTAQVGAGGYGFTAVPLPAIGSVASRSYVTPQQNALSDWLARVQLDPTYNLNTMQVSAYMNNWPLVMGGYSGAATVNTGVPELDMGAYGATTLGGNINMAGGTINAQAGLINMQAGTINLGGGMIQSITGGVPTGNDAIILNTNNGNGNPAITANFPCSVNSWNPNYYSAGNGQGIVELPSAGDTGPGQGTPCNFAIKATSVTVDGIVYANGFYAGTFIYNASDASLKKDMRPLVDPLKKVDMLNPISFAYKSNNQEALGVTAQDVEKVYPQLVAYGKDGKKFVNYEGLIAPLIGAVQELKHENEDLRSQLKEDEARQQKLEDELHQNRGH